MVPPKRADFSSIIEPIYMIVLSEIIQNIFMAIHQGTDLRYNLKTATKAIKILFSKTSIFLLPIFYLFSFIVFY